MPLSRKESVKSIKPNTIVKLKSSNGNPYYEVLRHLPLLERAQVRSVDVKNNVLIKGNIQEIPLVFNSYTTLDLTIPYNSESPLFIKSFENEILKYKLEKQSQNVNVSPNFPLNVPKGICGLFLCCCCWF